MRGSIAAFLLAASSFAFTALAGNGTPERLKILVRPKSLGGVPDDIEGEGYIYMTIANDPVWYDLGGVFELSYAELEEGSRTIVCIVETKSGPNELPPNIVPSSVGQVKRLRARSAFFAKNAFTRDQKLDRTDDPIPDAFRITCRRLDTVFGDNKKKREISGSAAAEAGGKEEEAIDSITTITNTIADKINENEARVTVWPKIDGKYDHKVMLSQGSGTLNFKVPGHVVKASISFGLPGVQCALNTRPDAADYQFTAANPLDLSTSRPNKVLASSVTCELPAQEAPPPANHPGT